MTDDTNRLLCVSLQLMTDGTNRLLCVSLQLMTYDTNRLLCGSLQLMTDDTDRLLCCSLQLMTGDTNRLLSVSVQHISGNISIQATPASNNIIKDADRIIHHSALPVVSSSFRKKKITTLLGVSRTVTSCIRNNTNLLHGRPPLSDRQQESSLYVNT